MNEQMQNEVYGQGQYGQQPAQYGQYTQHMQQPTQYGQYTQYTQYMQQPVQEKKGLSIASLVLGCVGFLAWCIPLFGYPVCITGLVLGIVGVNKGGKGMAIAGIIMCSLTLVFTLINSILGVLLA